MEFVNLGLFISATKRAIFETLLGRKPPTVGEYDEKVLQECFSKGVPQMGLHRYSPFGITFEFIFSGPGSGSQIFEVFVPTGERIVFLPIPTWVVESIWQGEISGSYHFESEATAQLAAFSEQLLPEDNAALFEEEKKMSKG